MAAACAVAGALTAGFAAAGRAPRAARSVHLLYHGPPGRVFFNTATIERSQRGSYFEVCGFSQGYFGLQELGDGKKVVIFSVWDAGRGNNPGVSGADRHARVLYQGTGAKASHFGGEGSGEHIFYNYNWRLGSTYRFMVIARAVAERTAYAAYFYLNRARTWKHLATFSTLAGKSAGLLGGYYSFIEDFLRNTRSAMQVRRACYGPGWVRGVRGCWRELARATFTASDSVWEAKKSIDSGVAKGRFYLQTGGNTRQHTKLGSMLTLPRIAQNPPAIARCRPVEPRGTKRLR
jgi:hypothetical protein